MAGYNPAHRAFKFVPSKRRRQILFRLIRHTLCVLPAPLLRGIVNHSLQLAFAQRQHVVDIFSGIRARFPAVTCGKSVPARCFARGEGSV